MRKILFFLFLLCITYRAEAQLTVSNVQTPAQLVQDVLLGPGITVSNITFNRTAARANAVSLQAASFDNGGTTNLGLNRGLLLTTGKSTVALGPNDSGWSTDPVSNPIFGDPDLLLLTTNVVKNVAILEFDFVPNGQNLDFRYIFASEEYPEWTEVPNNNDVFGFFLSGPGISGPFSNGAQNLAIIPFTGGDPVSIFNLNNGPNNLGPCNSCAYYVNNGDGQTPALNTGIQYDGFTIDLVASGAIQCGQTYHIKIAIGNVGDTNFDSGVFIDANSFSTSDINFPQDYLVATGLAPCYGETKQISTGLATTVIHEWRRNGVLIAGETGPVLNVVQPGEYCAVAYPYGVACPVNDCVVVEFNPRVVPVAQYPIDLYVGNAVFDLRSNEPRMFQFTNPTNYTTTYYHSYADAQSGTSPILNIASYTATAQGESIFVVVRQNLAPNCSLILDFKLFFAVADLTLCDDISADGFATFNLLQQDASILGGSDPLNFTVSYYTNAADANAAANAIGPSFTNTTNPQTIHTRRQNNIDGTFITGSFQLNVTALPIAQLSSSATICAGDAATVTITGTPNAVVNLTLNGVASQISLDAIGQASLITPPLGPTFIYQLISVKNPGLNGCSRDLSSTSPTTITVRSLPTATINGSATVCSDATQTISFSGTPNAVITYRVGSSPIINATLDALGNLILTTPPITSTLAYQLIGVQNATAPFCAQVINETAVVTSLPLPTATISGNATICSGNSAAINFSGTPGATFSYKIGGGPSLQAILNASGFYTLLTPVLNATVTYTLVGVQYSIAPFCTQSINQSATITVVASPSIPVVTNEVACESFVLPILPSGSTYHSAPGGSPSTALSGTINTTQRIYIYSQTGTVPNACVVESDFLVTINNSPQADDPLNVTQCGAYILPALNVGNYFSAPNGGGIAYFAGNIISSSMRMYVFANTGTSPDCWTENSFEIVVNFPPAAVTPPALIVCDPNSDGFASFNLSNADVFVSGGTLEPGVSITYHETAADALTGSNPKTGIYTNIVPDRQIMFVRVLYTADPRCINTVELELLVNPTPQATTISPLEECGVRGDGTANFDLTQANAGILNGLDPLLYTISYYTSETDANSGTNAITNLLAFNSASGPIWVRLEDNATGCFDVISLALLVNDLPTAPLVAALPYSKCDDNNPGDGQEEFDLSTQLTQILNGQTGMIVTFHFDDADAQAGQNPLPNTYTNVVNAQTIHVRIENSDTGCFVVTTMDLRVEPLPTLIPPPASLTTICDFNGDGFGDFDLSLLSNGILQGAPGVTISYHETLVDAQVGVREITGIYTNVNAFFQPIYVRAENNTTGCWNVIMIELNVIASPIVPVTPDQTICDEDDADGQDGYAEFDLTRDQAAMLANQGGNAADYTVEYFTTDIEADLGTSPIINATAYTNTTPVSQVIWVRVSDVNNTCYNIGSFTINVNAPLALPVAITPLSICDDGPTSVIPQRAFDLTIRDVLITGGLPGYTVTYYPSNTDAANNTNVITNPSAYVNIVNPQTLGVMVTSPDGCRSYSIMDIRVIQLPVVTGNTIPTLEVCAGDQVDLTQNEILIRNNDPGLLFTYYPSLADLQNRTNAIVFPETYVATGNVYILVTNNQVDYLGNNCFIVVVQPIKVNALPLVGAPVVLKGCDANLDGFEFFDLNDANEALLGVTQDPADYAITFYETQANAQSGTSPIASPSNYENTSNPQDVYVRIVDNVTGCINASGVVTLNVLAGAGASAVDFAIAGQCDTDGTNDGMFAFDLTQFETAILDGQDATLFTVSYFATLADATGNTSAIATPGAYLAGSGKAFAVVTNNATLCRSRIVEIDLLVEPLVAPKILTIDQSNTICVDFVTGDLLRGLTLNSSIVGPTYTYQWFYQGQPIAAPLGTSSTYLIDTATGAGEYGLVVTSTTALLCPSEQAVFTVVKSGPPVLRDPVYVVTGAFSDLQTIVATVDGFGEYLYALDDGPWLANNGVFENVSAGGHTIRIKDSNVVSCGEEIIQAIRIIDYPRYFTPNGDGIHDTWNIIGLDQESARIYIFDRYGKLLKQIAPDPEGQDGWDGTYNGHPLPSTDYWFMVEYLETAVDGTLINKEFRAHFSLKR